MKTLIFLFSSIVILSSDLNPFGCQNLGEKNKFGKIESNVSPIFSEATNVANLKPKGKILTPEMYGAIGDGREHKLSEKYKTLEDARKIYPNVTDLDITIDGAAFQKAVDLASLDDGEVLSKKKYMTNSPIVMKDNVIVDGNNKGILTNDRSRGKTLSLAFLFGNLAPYGFNKEENNGAGLNFYDVNEPMTIGEDNLTLTNSSDVSSFKVNQVVMIVSAFKRKQNVSKVMLPYHITMNKIVSIKNSRVYFEYPFDEKVDSVQICANGNLDNHTGINFGPVQNVVLRNMTIDASQISGSEYAYKCHIDNIRLIDGVRLVGMNAMAHSTFTNITGTFSWRFMEIKTGSHDLIVRNIHGTYKPIKGYPKAVDAISIGQYNRNVTVDSFDVDFGTGVPQISMINFRSRKSVISNGVITCKNQTTPFVSFHNEHYIGDPLFGCYGNTLSNVKFYGSVQMKTVFELGDGARLNKDKLKNNWATQKKLGKRKNKTTDGDDMSALYDAPQTADVPPQANIVENCLFDGGSVNAVAKFESGTNNTMQNCTFTNAQIKTSPSFRAANTMNNNRFR